MTLEEKTEPMTDARPKAVIFTHFGQLKYGKDRREFEANRRRLFNSYKEIIRSYLESNAEGNRIAIVFAYVNWAFQQEVVVLSKSQDKDSERSFTIDAKLLRQETALMDLLRMAEHAVRKELSLSRASAPIFHYIGISQLLDLLNNLIEVDPMLIGFLSGEGGAFTYDSPKFVEAVIRLARAREAFVKHPVIRIDEDACINASSIELLLEEYERISSEGHLFFFSGTYGSQPYFKITDDSLDHPMSNDLPTEVIEKLKALRDRTLEGEQTFLNALRPILGNEQTERYRSSIVKNFQHFSTFKVTDDSLEKLRQEGVTDEIITRLATVKGLLFQKEEELLGAIKGSDVDEEIGKYRALILKCASVRDGNYDPVNDHAVRVHWFVDPSNQGARADLISMFLADLSEVGATQALNSPPQILNSRGHLSDALQRALADGRPEARPKRKQPQVISGAGLTMSITAIHKLPPFMNFKNLTIWVDDHLKRRLHEALEHLPPGDTECLIEARIKQDRHPDGIRQEPEHDDIEWAKNEYLDRLLRGCLSLRLITNLDGGPTNYSKLIADIVRFRVREKVSDDISRHLKKEMMQHAQERYDEVIECWGSREFEGYASFEWARSRLPRGFKLTGQSLEALKLEGVSRSTIKRLSSIKNRKFKDERAFIEDLESSGGDERTTECQRLILKHAQFPPRFKITDEFIKTMEREGMTEGAIKKLRSIKNREFITATDESFLRSLKATIDGEQTAKHKSAIVKYSKQSSHRRQTCTDVVKDAMNYIELVLKWHIFVAAIENLPPEGNYWLFDPVD